ncbi:MAG: hypothetical protein PHT77_12160 [Bacteroidales bacterium]|jgi:hypothetical protein|nr:hypothetical protein [Bacteroidales bacterium]MDD3962601.1 hypothetical protein [Bacteroidales bacterium]
MIVSEFTGNSMTLDSPDAPWNEGGRDDSPWLEEEDDDTAPWDEDEHDDYYNEDIWMEDYLEHKHKKSHED